MLQDETNNGVLADAQTTTNRQSLVARARRMLPAPPIRNNCVRPKRCCSQRWPRPRWSETAAILSVGRATVVRLQQRFRQSVRPAAARRPRWGGRRKALLSVELEAQFLAPWAEQAKQAGELVLSPIRAALAQRLGRPVAASVVMAASARHGWRKRPPAYPPPQERSGGAARVGKKTPQNAGCRREASRTARAPGASDVPGRSPIWQDGSSPALLGAATVSTGDAPNGYERQFMYVYGAVSPLQGGLDWMICQRNEHRAHGGIPRTSRRRAHPDEFIVMILDGASSHKAKDLVIPENIRLVWLPPYAPQLNPQEHVWDELREKEFPQPGVQPHGRGRRHGCTPACRAWLEIVDRVRSFNSVAVDR